MHTAPGPFLDSCDEALDSESLTTTPDPAYQAAPAATQQPLGLPPVPHPAPPHPDASSPAPALAAAAEVHAAVVVAAATLTAASPEASGAHTGPPHTPRLFSAPPLHMPPGHTPPGATFHAAPDMSNAELAMEPAAHTMPVEGVRGSASERDSEGATMGQTTGPAMRSSDGVHGGHGAASPLEPGSSVSVPLGRVGPSSPHRQTSADSNGYLK